MSKNPKKKVLKSKKEIVSDIQLVQDTKRRRVLVRDILFPYLVEIEGTIGYSKLFLQSLSGLVNTVFDKQRKTTTITQLQEKLDERLKEIFVLSDPEQKKEYEKYTNLIHRLKDVSVDDFSYATELPRFVDGYFLQQQDKKKITEINIDELLGK